MRWKFSLRRASKENEVFPEDGETFEVSLEELRQKTGLGGDTPIPDKFGLVVDAEEDADTPTQPRGRWF